MLIPPTQQIPLKKRFSNGFEIELVEFYPHFSDWYITAEPETQQWLIDHVQKDWTCIEVGAHIGYTSMLMSTLGKQVIAFEPNEKSFNMFLNNVKHNESLLGISFDNIEVHNIAVGNQNGKSEETLWLTGMDNQFGETIGTFNFTTLDKFLLEEKQIKDLGLIFVDADGWDFDVIMGAQECIKKFHPFIIVEANYALKWRNHTAYDFLDFATNFGYSYQWIDRNCPCNMLLY